MAGLIKRQNLSFEAESFALMHHMYCPQQQKFNKVNTFTTMKIANGTPRERPEKCY